jgi:hypothetical protein
VDKLEKRGAYSESKIIIPKWTRMN